MTTIKVRPNTSSPFVTLGVAPTMAYTTDLGAVTGGSPVTVTHNLGTYDVAVQIVEKGTAGAGAAAGTLVDATVVLTSINALTVTFTSNAAANKYRVTVLAVGGTAGVSPNIIDAKGDLIVGSAADTASRLAVGANDLVLMAASGEATGLQYGPVVQTYTPALTATTTDPTLGTASVANGRWWRIGNRITVEIGIKFGTSGTAAGSGTYIISLPVAPRAATAFGDVGFLLGHGLIRDDTGAVYQIVQVTKSGDNCAMRYGATALVVTHAAPWAWAASDSINLTLSYEAA